MYSSPCNKHIARTLYRNLKGEQTHILTRWLAWNSQQFRWSVDFLDLWFNMERFAYFSAARIQGAGRSVQCTAPPPLSLIGPLIIEPRAHPPPFCGPYFVALFLHWIDLSAIGPFAFFWLDCAHSRGVYGVCWTLFGFENAPTHGGNNENSWERWEIKIGKENKRCAVKKL